MVGKLDQKTAHWGNKKREVELSQITDFLDFLSKNLTLTILKFEEVIKDF